ncbi:MAG: class I tRNA ligase family protein [Candidatus Nomurabacteria bacterium]|jgi:valyl-tRNA synthetase|nr:class I tRNA ligase family protein [Candidatus Nomurabacteria bacterium]
MRFEKVYEPRETEAEIYALWEASGVFKAGGRQRKSDDGQEVLTGENDGEREMLAGENGGRTVAVAVGEKTEVKGKKTAAKGERKPREIWSTVMPPPNANGNLHIGHGFEMSLKDVLARHYRLQGRDVAYIPGADHAGFETWVVYERALERIGKTRFDFTRDELYAQVWDFVQKNRSNMEIQIRQLGISCDWSALTFTLDPKVVATVYETFRHLWADGLVYRGHKIANFCPKHQTSFADIEITHRDEQGWMWDIAYPIVGGEASDKDEIPREIIVSTTRPETLLGDTAVAVNPKDERYSKYIGLEVEVPLTDEGATQDWAAADGKGTASNWADGMDGATDAVLTGARRRIPIIADDYVDETFGTGAVKITPAHDPNDFEVGLRHHLDEISVIGINGKMLPAAGERYANLDALDARERVVAGLEEQGYLRGKHEITHTVGHCYKCDSVIQPLLSNQWFIKVRPLAERAAKALGGSLDEKVADGDEKAADGGEKVARVAENGVSEGEDGPVTHVEGPSISGKGEIGFYPASKRNELLAYYSELRDWNISRQIPWGIPIPAFQNVADASDWIFDERVEEQFIEVDGKKYKRDEDTFDTWFSSGQWPYITTDAPIYGSLLASRHSSGTNAGALAPPLGAADASPIHFRSALGVGEASEGPALSPLAKYYPNSVMECGTDLLRPWVAKMIMFGLYATGEVPFKEVYFHGMVQDEHGKKMSKSKGNVISPMEVIAEYGADAFRLGVIANRSAGQAQAFSRSGVISGRNFCNKLWNMSRFVQATVGEDYGEDLVGADAHNGRDDVDEAGEREETPVSELNLRTPAEHWVVAELNSAREKLAELLAGYRFSEAIELVYATVWGKVADWFIEAEKASLRAAEQAGDGGADEVDAEGRAGTGKNAAEAEQRRIRAILAYVLEFCLKLTHPLAPFVTETIWQALSWTDDLLADEKWGDYAIYDIKQRENFAQIMQLVEEIRFVEANIPERKQKDVLIFGSDELVAENAELIRGLAKLEKVRGLAEKEQGKLAAGESIGLRLANSGREAWLEIDEKTIEKYARNLHERVAAVKGEIEQLERRLGNEAYVARAPEELVAESRANLAEKQAVLARLLTELGEN